MDIKSQLEQFGIAFQDTGGAVHMRTTLAGMRRLYDAAPSLAASKNPDGARSIWAGTELRPEFCGGTRDGLLEAMSGKVDLTPFLDEKKRLAATGLLGKLQTRMADVSPRRKRAMSEHDGEWSMDRRWEVQPFSTTKRAMGAARTLRIVCHFCINASADAASINRYGAMVWAIAELVENAGITCGITWRHNSREAMPHAKRDYVGEVEIKKPGQYMAPTLLAAVFSSNFYRRAGFAAEVAAAEWAGFLISSGLGSAHRIADPIKFDAGVLTLTPDCRRATTEQLETELLKALA